MKNNNPYIGLHHVSLPITDLDRSLDFYLGVLGFEVDENRPDFNFAGAWLKAGQQQIHLLALGQAIVGTGADSPGRDAHFALLVDDLGTVEKRLDKEAVAYNKSQSGRAALFCRDPDGNGIEFIASRR